MFKDEAGGKQTTEFVGLRAEVYSFEMANVHTVKKYKGVGYAYGAGVKMFRFRTSLFSSISMYFIHPLLTKEL